MLKSLAFRVFAALLIAAVVGVNPAAADLPGEVAHSAMGGSTLMRTTAQFNSWTHWIVDYDSFVELSVSDDYYGWRKEYGLGRGQASLHWKYDDSNHLFFRVRQCDLGSQNSNFFWGGTLDMPFLTAANIIDRLGVSGYNAYAEGQMLNLAWARPLASGGAFSLGLLYADTGYKEEETDEDDYVNESSAFGGQVTWGNGSGFDLAASFYSEGSTYGAGDGEVESDFTHFDLTGRFEHSSGWVFQLGGIMGSGTTPEDEGEEEVDVDVSLMGVTFNAGRHLLDTPQGAVTAEFYVGYYGLKAEIEDYEYKESAMLVPGTRVAAWTQISKRFQVMAGANAFWVTSKDEESMDDDEYTESWRGMNFFYSGGLAFVPNERFRLEGELDMGNLNQLLSLGNSTPLLLRVGGTYTF